MTRFLGLLGEGGRAQPRFRWVQHSMGAMPSAASVPQPDGEPAGAGDSFFWRERRRAGGGAPVRRKPTIRQEQVL